jgi:hypothetical protein
MNLHPIDDRLGSAAPTESKNCFPKEGSVATTRFHDKIARIANRPVSHEAGNFRWREKGTARLPKRRRIRLEGL